MLPLAFKTALKVSVSGALSYAIAQFFDFSFSFAAPVTSGMTVLAGELMGWFFLFQVTLAAVSSLIVGMIEFYTLGYTPFLIFINVFLLGILWYYLNSHGLLLGFFILMLTYSTVLIISSNTDKITMAYDVLSCSLIGIVTGLIINSSLWSTSGHEKLEQQLSAILESSQQLCDQIFNGYLLGKYEAVEGQKLRLKILQSYQASQKLVKLSSFDITGYQLGKTDWPSILKTEANLSLHFSALLYLVQTSKQIDLPKELKTDLEKTIQSLIICLPKLKAAMMAQNDSGSFNHSLNQLNRDFFQFSQTLENFKIRSDMKKISISKILFFYSMVHRLKKLINELNTWDRHLLASSLNSSKMIKNAK